MGFGMDEEEYDEELVPVVTDEQVVDSQYCDYCEIEGHTFKNCPKRDDHDPEPDDHEDIG
jgi:hypothetical protein